MSYAKLRHIRRRYSASAIVLLMLSLILLAQPVSAQRAHDRGAGLGTNIENSSPRGWEGLGGLITLALIGFVLYGVGSLLKASWQRERELSRKAKAAVAKASSSTTRQEETKAVQSTAKSAQNRLEQAADTIRGTPADLRDDKAIHMYGRIARDLGMQALYAFERDEEDAAVIALQELATVRTGWFNLFYLDNFNRLMDDYGTDGGLQYKYVNELNASAKKHMGSSYKSLKEHLDLPRLRNHFPHLVGRGSAPVVLGAAADAQRYFSTAFDSKNDRIEHMRSLLPK